MFLYEGKAIFFGTYAEMEKDAASRSFRNLWNWMN